MRRKIHLTLQLKNGTGRTVVAWLLVQYRLHIAPREELAVFNADPFGGSLLRRSTTGVIEIPGLATTSGVDCRSLDTVVEAIVREDRDTIVDLGGAVFTSVVDCLLSPGAAQVFASAGRAVVGHIVLSGGKALVETLSGAVRLIEKVPSSAAVVLWANQYFAPMADDFLQPGSLGPEMEALRRHRDRIDRVVRLPYCERPEAEDLAETMKRGLGLVEALSSPDLPSMMKSRLERIQHTLFEQLEGL